MQAGTASAPSLRMLELLETVARQGRPFALADAIAKSARTGEPVPEKMFQRVADLLVAAKLI